MPYVETCVLPPQSFFVVVYLRVCCLYLLPFQNGRPLFSYSGFNYVWDGSILIIVLCVASISRESEGKFNIALPVRLLRYGVFENCIMQPLFYLVAVFVVEALCQLHSQLSATLTQIVLREMKRFEQNQWTQIKLA